MASELTYVVYVIYGDGPVAFLTENVDVEVTFSDGRRYGTTAFTPANLSRLLEKDATTGEHGRGVCFWTEKMFVVKNISYETICDAIKILIERNELDGAFESYQPA